MQILCIGGAFLPIATLYSNLIIARGKSDVYMWSTIAQGCAILGCIILVHCIDTLSTVNCQLSTITLMVLAYVIIIILWIGIWHRFLYREIHYPFLSALKDTFPFLLVAAATMVITYFATSWIEDSPLLLLLIRILLAALIYLGSLWLFGAKILRECIGFLLKKGAIADFHS